MQLYLIRHPVPDVAKGICYGRTDLPLLAPAVEAAERVCKHLPPDTPLFTSPLQRCRRLAEHLHGSPRVDERLQEMNFGVWEMQPWAKIPRQEINRWATDPLDFAPTDGESVAQLQRRVLAFVADLLLESIESAVLVTHAGVIKVLAGAARALPATEWMRLEFDYESVVCLEIDHDAVKT